eukprot:TRINITY_DN375_c0_g1_i1.p1 TRINITY_DN375_c0_g1~~TRINITY_DN375_c0_g1_i1.p1  ORF type:complete len:548 (-),score=120.34 TRINITY_DN375_c0_g1_i1:993-2636(-)
MSSVFTFDTPDTTSTPKSTTNTTNPRQYAYRTPRGQKIGESLQSQRSKQQSKLGKQIEAARATTEAMATDCVLPALVSPSSAALNSSTLQSHNSNTKTPKSKSKSNRSKSKSKTGKKQTKPKPGHLPKHLMESMELLSPRKHKATHSSVTKTGQVAHEHFATSKFVNSPSSSRNLIKSKVSESEAKLLEIERLSQLADRQRQFAALSSLGDTTTSSASKQPDVSLPQELMITKANMDSLSRLNGEGKPVGALRNRPANVWFSESGRNRLQHLLDNPPCTCGAGEDVSFLYDAAHYDYQHHSHNHNHQQHNHQHVYDESNPAASSDNDNQDNVLDPFIREQEQFESSALLQSFLNTQNSKAKAANGKGSRQTTQRDNESGSRDTQAKPLDSERDPLAMLELPPTLIPNEYHVVLNNKSQPLNMFQDKYAVSLEEHFNHDIVFPSLRPTSRWEVMQLAHTMDAMLEKAGIDIRESLNANGDTTNDNNNEQPDDQQQTSTDDKQSQSSQNKPYTQSNASSEAPEDLLYHMNHPNHHFQLPISPFPLPLSG